MSTRTLFKLSAIGAIGLLFSAGHASASCSGTAVTPSGESTAIGIHCGGDYTDLASSNDTREALCEALSGANSRLDNTWTFTGVPAGNIKLIREGYRLPGCDNDNFKFQVSYDYNDGNGPHFLFGYVCTVSSETEATSECSLSTTTTDTATFTVKVVDTVTTGSQGSISLLSLDYLAVCSE